MRERERLAFTAAGIAVALYYNSFYNIYSFYPGNIGYHRTTEKPHNRITVKPKNRTLPCNESYS